MSKLRRDRLAASDSEVGNGFRKTSGQGQDPDRTHGSSIAPEDRWASVFGNTEIPVGKRPSTSKYAVGRERSENYNDTTERNVTTGAQPSRQSEAASSIEDLTDLSGDSDEESSTRYELTTPIFGRMRQNGDNKTGRITDTTKTKTRDENTGILPVISRTDILEDKMARMTNTMEQMADCMKKTLETVNTIQKSLAFAKDRNRSPESQTNSMVSNGEKSPPRGEQNQKPADTDEEQKELREWEEEIQRQMNRVRNDKAKLRGNIMENVTSKNNASINGKQSFSHNSTEQISRGIVESSDDELSNDKQRSECRDEKKCHTDEHRSVSRDGNRRRVDEHRSIAGDNSRREPRLQNDRQRMVKTKPTMNNQKSHSRKNVDITEAHEGQHTSINNETDRWQFPVANQDDHLGRYQREQTTSNKSGKSESKQNGDHRHPTNYLADRGHSKPRMLPEKYAGNSPVESFKAQFEGCAAYNGWDDDDKVAYLRWCLTGIATQVLWDAPYGMITYEELMQRIIQRFGNQGQEEKFRSELRGRKRRRNEPLQSLYQDVRRLMSLAYPGEASNFSELYAMDMFLNALDDHKLELRCREHEPKDLDGALRIAMRLEQYEKALEPGYSRINRQLQQDCETASKDYVRRLETKIRTMDKKIEEGQRSTNDLQKKLETRNEGAIPVQAREEQARTLESTRGMDEIKRILSSNTTPGPGKTHEEPSDRQNWQRNVTCYRCKGIGHISRYCPMRNDGIAQQRDGNQNASRGPPNSRPVTQNRVLRAQTETGKVYVRATVKGIGHDCLLDSGSELSIFPRNIVKGETIRPTIIRMNAANGTPIEMLGQAEVMFNFDGKMIKVTGLVSDKVFEIMLGEDFLSSNKAVWNFASGQLCMQGKEFPMYAARSSGAWSRRVVVSENTIIPASCEMVITAKQQHRNLHTTEVDSSGIWMTENGDMKCGLKLARILVDGNSDSVPIRLINPNTAPVKLSRGTVLTNLSEVEDIMEEAISGSERTDEGIIHVQPIMSAVPEEISESTKLKLQDLLIEYKDIFSQHEYDLGYTDLITHHIDTRDHHPVRQPLRRQPPLYQQIIKEQTEQMLAAGVIEPSDSEWASNVVLVKKRDGKMRYCIDYRGVNTLTKKDSFPLPRIDQCLDTLNGSQYFSTFDLTSGYHQVGMAPEDADRTAFVTRDGLFRFKKLPFGLTNAGATFSRLMCRVLQGINFVTCLAYLDDIVIFSTSEQQHIERLTQLFERIRIAKLKFKPSKCQVLKTSINFLGHTIDRDGIHTEAEKVQAVRE